MGEKSYANAWLALLPQAHVPSVAAQAVARECAKFADWRTGQNVRPGRKRLAWNLNTSQDTVKVAMGVCVAHGVLKVVTKGGVKGPRTQAAVYCLSVPEHLATPENLATFPDAGDVVIVRPKVVSQPKYPANNPDDELPAGSGFPTDSPPPRSPSGERAPRAAGSGFADQWGTGYPPPSIDPPDTLQENSADHAASQVDASRRAAADADGTQQRRTNADGIRAVRAALQQAVQSPGGP